MKTKSLKIQLLILFFIAVINVLFYVFPHSFGDNLFSITDADLAGGMISYFFSSLLAIVSYFTGVWTIAALFLSALIYSFFISRRDVSSDVFLPVIIYFMLGSLTYLIYPQYVGTGVNYLVDEYLSVYSMAFSSFVFLGLVFYLTFQGAFVETLVRSTNWLSFIGKKGIVTSAEKAKTLYLNFRPNKRLQITDYATPKKKREIKLPKISTAFLKKEKTEESIQKVDEPIVEENIIQEVPIELEPIAPKEVMPSSAKPQAKPEIRSQNIQEVNYATNELINKLSDKVEKVQVEGPDNDYYKQISQAIEEKLAEFNISTKIVGISKGPVVDTFELALGEGVKVSKVINLSDDISMALRGTPIRLIYPLKGKTTVGIEVPRSKREFIYLDEILNSENFNNSTMRLPIAMGRDVFGDVSVVDLAAMPHMLVAGATGAGKSVFVNSLLVSLLVKKSPRDMKLLLIDPKQLELALYSNLPHLCLPVITEAKNAGVALLWAVEEMERRYTILKNMGVRNIEDFNKKIKTCSLDLLSKITEFYSEEESDGFELPYIVIVIDEFADLILTKYGKEIENSVNRLAAKARAAGIHLVLATQRPSTDIITGVIKANFPTRVAFRVTTATDSRVVLDANGAEKLLGKGDMLYKFGVNLDRLHSSYIDEDEITGLVDALEKMPGSYSSTAMNFLDNGGNSDDEIISGPGFQGSTGGASGDDLYDEAVRVVMEQGSASASMLQRRLRVGYNRAANLVEEMERNGIVGPQEGSKPRKVLSYPQE